MEILSGTMEVSNVHATMAGGALILAIIALLFLMSGGHRLRKERDAMFQELEEVKGALTASLVDEAQLDDDMTIAAVELLQRIAKADNTQTEATIAFTELDENWRAQSQWVRLRAITLAEEIAGEDSALVQVLHQALEESGGTLPSGATLERADPTPGDAEAGTNDVAGKAT